tara:strand:+ start:249 stop:512 length:264 start_codon:yes stop_codon:yes gene_type:complete
MSKVHGWASPDRNIPAGTLVRFVHAPPRYNGEDPRSPGDALLGELAIVVEFCGNDVHDWGGIFMMNLNKTGKQLRYYGDFLEIVCVP